VIKITHYTQGPEISKALTQALPVGNSIIQTLKKRLSTIDFEEIYPKP